MTHKLIIKQNKTIALQRKINVELARHNINKLQLAQASGISHSALKSMLGRKFNRTITDKTIERLNYGFKILGINFKVK